jgi:hypothetical protein
MARTLDGVPTLSVGAHRDPADGMCAMEAAAWLAGEEHTDRPQCVCPVLAAACRQANDDGDDAVRERLRAMLSLLIRTRSSADVERRRAYVLTDVAVRAIAPRALDAAGMAEAATTLRALPEVVDRATARAAADAADYADDAYYAARAAAADAAAAAAAADYAADAARAAYYAAAADAAAAAAADADAWTPLLDALERAAMIGGE